MPPIPPAQLIGQSLHLVRPAALKKALHWYGPHRFDDTGCRQAAVYAVIDSKARFLLIQKPCFNDGYPWSGQVAFPGGHLEKDDAGFLDAALREVTEEVGIDRRYLETAGSLGRFPTINNVSIEAYVGFLKTEVKPKAQAGEVEQILWADLAGLMQTHLKSGFANREIAIKDLLYPLCGLTIWGATARIIQYFLDMLLNYRDQ